MLGENPGNPPDFIEGLTAKKSWRRGPDRTRGGLSGAPEGPGPGPPGGAGGGRRHHRHPLLEWVAPRALLVRRRFLTLRVPDPAGDVNRARGQMATIFGSEEERSNSGSVDYG